MTPQIFPAGKNHFFHSLNHHRKSQIQVSSFNFKYIYIYTHIHIHTHTQTH